MVGSSLTVNRKGEREREREKHTDLVTNGIPPLCSLSPKSCDLWDGTVYWGGGRGPPQSILSRNIFTETPSAILY